MQPSEVYAEIQTAMAALEGRDRVDARAELASNVYPLMQLLVEAMADRDAEIEERFVLMEQAVTEALTGAESMVLPDLANQIKGCLAVGLYLCGEVVKFHAVASRAFQDLGGEPIGLPEPLARAINAYQHNYQITTELLDGVTVEITDDDENDDENDDEDDLEIVEIAVTQQEIAEAEAEAQKESADA